jgi:hypothetical protein
MWSFRKVSQTRRAIWPYARKAIRGAGLTQNERDLRLFLAAHCQWRDNDVVGSYPNTQEQSLAPPQIDLDPDPTKRLRVLEANCRLKSS